MSEKATGRGSDQFPLRLPDGMREQIRRASESSGRSMNAEIINRLQASFEPARLATMLEASLPPSVFQALELGSVINQVSVEERLSQIIAGSLRVESEYDKLFETFMEVSDQKRELQEQVADLRSQINFEFMGHYTRVVQMNTLLGILDEQHSRELGPITGKIVKDMLRINAQELEMLKARREELYRNELEYRKKLEVARQTENPAEES